MSEKIIDIKNGHILSDNYENVIVLKGKTIEKDSNYIDGLALEINGENSNNIKELKIDEGGYDFSLYVGDFNGDDLDEILVVGQSGGSGGYAIASIYKIENNSIVEIFNLDQYLASNSCNGEYLDGFLMKILYSDAMNNFIIYLGNNEKGQVKSIYDKNGKVITKETPIISYVNAVNPIYNTITNILNIQLLQRIIGNNNSDILAIIQTEISLKENKINIINRFVLNLPNVIRQVMSDGEKFRSIIGENITLLKIGSADSDDNIIIRDLNGDGKDEMIIAYKNGENQYLALVRENKGNMEILDVIQGEGDGIRDLYISQLRQRGKEAIIVGWQLNNMWAVLDIYEVINNKFIRQIVDEKPNYTRLEVKTYEEKKGNTINLVLWCHDTGEAYEVKMLTLKGNNLTIDRKFEREYFKEVEDYYIELIDRTREAPQYLYYLADAQYRIGKKAEALQNIEKILASKRPYPSFEAVKKLKRRITQ